MHVTILSLLGLTTIECVECKQYLADLAPKADLIPTEPVERVGGQFGEPQEADRRGRISRLASLRAPRGDAKLPSCLSKHFVGDEENHPAWPEIPIVGICSQKKRDEVFWFLSSVEGSVETV